MLALLAIALGLVVGGPEPIPTGLWLSPIAQQQLRDLPGDRKYEHLACLVGGVGLDVVRVDSLVPVKVDSLHEGKLWIVRQNACVDVPGTVGIVHSHPDTERCWYNFPGTVVPTSDAYAAKSSPFPIDAISCAGESLVWVNKKGLEQRMVL